MKKTIVLAFALAAGFCYAQKKTDPSPFANSIGEEGLKHHLYILAGKEYEGRETATEGQRKAAVYIEQYFKQLGLLPGNRDSYQLYYPVYRDSLQHASISVNNDSFALWTDFDLSIGSNYSASMAGSQVVFAGYGISDSLEDDYRNLDVRGKIVMILNGYPSSVLQSQINGRRFNPFAKADAAQRHGAVAVLVIQDDFPRRAAPPVGNMYLTGYQKLIRPLTFNVSEKIARAIMGADFEQAKSQQWVGKTYAVNTALSFSKKFFQLQSSDVLGYLEGTDLKDELLIISAHYDHLGKKDTVIYFGADDDGSGTVSVLEIAKAFVKAKADGRGPRRSILFLANSGEEKGLWGSAYYADHPVYPLEKTTADLNIDMIGRRDPGRQQGDSNNYVYIVGDDKLSTELHSINVGANKSFTHLELDYKFNDPRDPLRIYYRSDHYNFAKKGVPVIFYFDGIHKDYHQPTDTPDKINYDLMAKRARLVFYTAWEMANRDGMIRRDKPLAAE
jgi:Peptidase family M28/PA domain